MIRVIRLVSLSALLSVACGFAFFAHAGLRGPGKYCGVVIFDRWDTCLLLSGPYITYVSDSVKHALRPYRGQAVQVDASDVFQPMNPGDALIRKYEIVGPAPDLHRISLDGLELKAEADFGTEATPSFLIQVRNVSNYSVTIVTSEIAPVLLTRKLAEQGSFEPSDGDSIAMITRRHVGDFPNNECAEDATRCFPNFAVDPESALPSRFELSPGQARKVKIAFLIPQGQYQFLFGYGGGVHEDKSLASNAISFDVNGAGVATLVN